MINVIANWLTTIPTDSALWLIVVVFILLDVLLGTVKAFLSCTLSSKIARAGIMHKMGFLGAMLLCNFIDIAQSVGDFGFQVPVTGLCAVMIVTCEVMSICEHIQELNPDLNLGFLENKEPKTIDSDNGN